MFWGWSGPARLAAGVDNRRETFPYERVYGALALHTTALARGVKGKEHLSNHHPSSRWACRNCTAAHLSRR